MNPLKGRRKCLPRALVRPQQKLIAAAPARHHGESRALRDLRPPFDRAGKHVRPRLPRNQLENQKVAARRQHPRRFPKNFVVLLERQMLNDGDAAHYVKRFRRKFQRRDGHPVKLRAGRRAPRLRQSLRGPVHPGDSRATRREHRRPAPASAAQVEHPAPVQISQLSQQGPHPQPVSIVGEPAHRFGISLHEQRIARQARPELPVHALPVALQLRHLHRVGSGLLFSHFARHS